MRTVVALIATAGLALLAAACGGSAGNQAAQRGSTTAAGGSGSASMLAFSRCMRSHGVAKFPDPVAGVDLPKISPAILKVSSSQFNAAENACRNLLPSGEISGSNTGISDAVERCIVGGVCTPPVTHWLLSKELPYAQCMRSHGLPSWPDPSTDPQGRIYFAVSPAWAAHPPEPQSGRCEHLTHAPIR
jgi:hypothetical protein